MNRDLDIVLVGHAQTAIDRGGIRSPIFRQLQSNRTTENLLGQARRKRGVSLAGEPKIQWQTIRGLQHHAQMMRARRTSGRASAGGRTGAAADKRGDTAGDGFIRLLRADVMNVRIDSPSG